jgi:hypothetical protein
MKCLRVTSVFVRVALDSARYPEAPNSAATEVPTKGTWIVLPAPLEIAVKLLEKALREGSFPFIFSITASARTDGAGVTLLAIDI